MSVKLLPDIGDLAEGLGVTGIAALLLLPVFAPVIARVGKPITKTMIKGAILFYEKNKEAIAELGDTWDDIVAEARAELAEERPMKSAKPIE
ncbi:DUF5132 domain-containing protein [Fischerella thermalis]|uniref:DUF5132 domain-containing protein n=1 Tax=Fischerella thermalis JSC-11 TaxID=741277 RepID=G6FR05_9CYAN|nr:DUF5132 domain-containing protein [Fischerella thermalis]PLZ79626.1 DUF5132 domain-containing protein [Fischerella thermalis WC217]PMB02557.1 DUF5132 domain-containing protein [Fischerella thermalis CCMEE 5328]EHC15879.1 hypothetical protein FJSC11DRAFT_1302 [Fischerella thermalis JSC-11]PLZ11187.1 DUF5132 domain-containing protein [Fischerella thermalis WC119]PLZ15339.1 DUF5132 domain-containing protein [Fischerella thermalis WC114]